jgi:hypothetical protein
MSRKKSSLLKLVCHITISHNRFKINALQVLHEDTNVLLHGMRNILLDIGEKLAKFYGEIDTTKKESRDTYH